MDMELWFARPDCTFFGGSNVNDILTETRTKFWYSLNINDGVDNKPDGQIGDWDAAKYDIPLMEGIMNGPDLMN